MGKLNGSVERVSQRLAKGKEAADGARSTGTQGLAGTSQGAALQTQGLGLGFFKTTSILGSRQPAYLCL